MTDYSDKVKEFSQDIEILTSRYGHIADPMLTEEQRRQVNVVVNTVASVNRILSPIIEDIVDDAEEVVVPYIEDMVRPYVTIHRSPASVNIILTPADNANPAQMIEEINRKSVDDKLAAKVKCKCNIL